MATTKGIDAGLVGDLMMQAVEKRFGSNGKPPHTIEWLTDLLPTSRTKVMEQSPLISENSGYETIQIYR